MTMERQAFGKTGEDQAVAELERLGYAILDRRYRTRHGEIDIVARDASATVFVEVKARATAEFGSAAEAVTPLKQRRLQSMALDYLARHGCSTGPAVSTSSPSTASGKRPSLPYIARHSRRAERVAALIGRRALWYDCHFRTVVWPSS